MGFANVVSLEGAEHGIFANTVLPFGYSRMVTETVGEDTEELSEAAAFLRVIDPELVVPMVVFLASRSCRLTHHTFSAGAGRFARVFVGLAEGWSTRGGEKSAAEDIEANLEAISAIEPFTVPGSIGQIWSRLGT